MIEVVRTDLFIRWLDGVVDARAVAKITLRLGRLALGNPGDVAPVGEGVSELRIDYGPGYRVYFVQRSRTIVIRLGGGTKATQTSDIKAAKSAAKKV
jgi:putative addiction module killer protein